MTYWDNHSYTGPPPMGNQSDLDSEGENEMNQSQAQQIEQHEQQI